MAEAMRLATVPVSITAKSDKRVLFLFFVPLCPDHRDSSPLLVCVPAWCDLNSLDPVADEWDTYKRVWANSHQHRWYGHIVGSSR